MTIAHGDTGPNLHASVLLLEWQPERLLWASAGLFVSKEDAAAHLKRRKGHFLFINVHQLGTFLSLGVGLMVDQLVTPLPPPASFPKKGVKRGR